MNHKKAYLIGLLVGGGKIDKNAFVIDLPFNKWGMEVKRMSSIATEILTKLQQYFIETYQITIGYDIGNTKWVIRPVGDCDITLILNDLRDLGLPYSGFLLNNADLAIVKQKLKGVAVEHFLSGIFDTRASLAASHRRFVSDAPVVSIEIPGSTRNFKFVVQLCGWLTDLGSVTDQILYNHPSQHASSDPFYKGWQKGFKIRFLVKSFLAQHSFVLQAKTLDVVDIEHSQQKTEQVPCYLRKLQTPSTVAIHESQDAKELPIEVRNKVFFHYLHFCAVLDCPHAPKQEIEIALKKYKEHILFFPKMSKGTFIEMEPIFKNIGDEFYKNQSYLYSTFMVKELLNTPTLKDFGLETGLAYLFSNDLNGKRHTGSMQDIFDTNTNELVQIIAFKAEFDSPLLVQNQRNGRAFICASPLISQNQNLINSNISINKLNIEIK
jgi:hypothetical protein